MQIGELDAAYASVFREGVAFLLDSELRRGQQGLWVPKTSQVGCCALAARLLLSLESFVLERFVGLRGT